MTSSPITPNSFYQEGTTAPVTHAHSGQEKTHIPGESSPVKRHIPSSWERCSPQWLTSPSDKRETKPFVLKYNASKVPTTELETWPRTWPISRNCTMTHDGRNRTPCGPLPAPMPSAALSHTSFTMPQRPRTFHRPCSTPASMTSQMDGSTAPSSITSAANGVRGMGTPHDTVCTSISAYSAMGQGIKNSYATSLTKDATPVGSATFPTTTPEWPTPIACRTSGPLDDGRTLTRG
jgi:hypothetical protein